MTDALLSPPDLHYLVDHQVWARVEGDGTATVGITQLGIRLSGEVYMCRAKRVGTALAQGDTMAVVELSKSVVPVKTPVGGTVVAVNEALDERPELIHRDPYGEGWIVRLRLADLSTDQAQLVTGDAVAPAMAHHAWLHRLELVPATNGGAPAADAP
ncbi:MAG: glycine cleavage system protein H [Proteobacteria bacterium]|jgi:glycine cleavage system H protein|nr:glycine cleavage system protein H [Pseudomonadota bacterium]